MSDDFSAAVAPDLVEPLRGLRVFKVDHTGHLNSLYYKHLWLVGENRATCHPPSTMFVPMYHRRVDQERREIGHEDWLDCRCGYYAYTDGSNTYRTPCQHPGTCGESTHRQVSGLIDAWGRMVVGPRGFRAELARITALIMPEGSWLEVRRNYPLPVFATEAEALAEFPLTSTEGMAAA